MIYYFPVIIGKFSENKKKFLESKINLPTVLEIQYLPNAKYRICRKIAEVNFSQNEDIDSPLYGEYIETIFYVSRSSPLYRRLQDNGFRVVSTDQILRNFDSSSSCKAIKIVRKFFGIKNKNKEKTRRISHARMTLSH